MRFFLENETNNIEILLPLPAPLGSPYHVPRAGENPSPFAKRSSLEHKELLAKREAIEHTKMKMENGF